MDGFLSGEPRVTLQRSQESRPSLSGWRGSVSPWTGLRLEYDAASPRKADHRLTARRHDADVG
jgi:hypothetical protein